jgi:transposase InsO family protein
MLTHGYGEIPRLREYVRAFVATCPCCQKASQWKPAIHTLRFTMATYEPWHRIDVDSIGPLPECSEGYRYILVIIDAFSRFVNLFPMKTIDARSTADKLMEHFCMFGFSNEVMSDKGSQFVNDALAELCTKYSITQRTSMAYSKQENSIVERANKEVNRHLRNIFFDKRVINSWAEELKLVQRIMNSTIHSRLGCAPAAIIFGFSNKLDNVIMNSISNMNSTQMTPRQRARHISRQAAIIEMAQTLQYEFDSKHLLLQNDNITIFPNNSYVLVKNNNPNKFEMPWMGPFRVIGSQGNKYTLLNINTGIYSEHHLDTLKLFQTSDYVDADEVATSTALRDQNHYIVQSIVKHSGSFSKISKMKFEVKWAGFNETTFEDYWTLRHNVIFHKYLADNNQAHRIMKLYQKPSTHTP